MLSLLQKQRYIYFPQERGVDLVLRIYYLESTVDHKASGGVELLYQVVIERYRFVDVENGINASQKALQKKENKYGKIDKY